MGVVKFNLIFKQRF